MSALENLYNAVVAGDLENTGSLTQACLDRGYRPGQIISQALIPGMDTVGERFQNNEIYVPEMLISAKCMQDGMDVLKPLLTEGEVKKAGRVIIGTVKGDLHDIGKNLVAIMLEGAGFEVVDLGMDVSAGKFVEKVKELKPDLVGMSSLLTTTTGQMGVAIEALVEAGVRDQVRVMVGGAPVTAEFARKIGADIYAPDAAAAVSWAKKAVAGK